MGRNRTTESKVMVVWICMKIPCRISNVSIYYGQQSNFESIVKAVKNSLELLCSHPSVSIHYDAILPRNGPITRAMSKRLHEDWARVAEEGLRVLMNLMVDFWAHGPRLGPFIFVQIRLGFHYFWALYLGLYKVGYTRNVGFFSPCILGHLD